MAHGWKSPDSKVHHIYFGRNRPPSGWLAPILEGTKLLVGMNIKFDLLHALQDEENLCIWMKYVADGGLIWDIQLAEYLLCGMDQPNQMLSLDEIAPRYGGNVKIDEVKALWEAGWQTEDIDPELLVRYLCGGDDEHGVYQLGDVENTEKVALGQIAKARAAGQVNSIILNMGALIASIEMERNGIFVDKAMGLELAAELSTEIEQIRTQLNTYLPAGLPFEFNWGSNQQKSALFFGGQIKYDRREYQQVDGSWSWEPGLPTQSYAQEEVVGYLDVHGEVFSEREVREMRRRQPDGTTVSLSMHEWARFKAGARAGEIKTKKVKVDDLTKPKSRMGQATYTFPRMTEPKPEWKNGSGFYSVGEEVIETLANRGIPFCRVLDRLTKATKDLGTYFITTDSKGEEKGLLTLVDTHGIVHHSINHTSTVTGRFSASNPNTQNFPKGKNSKVKRILKSRFGEDGVIIQSDFTALEIYIQAIITTCKQLILDLKAGLDMHCLRLANKEGMPYDEVKKLAKGYTDEHGVKHPAIEEWDYKRTDAKVYSFQAAYGAGDQKIHESTGIPIETVAAFRAADNERYPEIEAYFEVRTKEIEANARFHKNMPHPEVPGLMCNIKRSVVCTPDGKHYCYVQQPAPGYLVKRGTFASFSPTQIKNYEVQGEGAEWAKAAMYLAVRAYYSMENWGGKALLTNQVHDAVYSDAHKDVALDAAACLHAAMECASEYMEFMFKWTVPVPVPSDTTWGGSMAEEGPVEGLEEQAATWKTKLRAQYMPNFKASFL